jgi:hypothetical protein
LIGAFKASQFHPWLSELRHRPRAALLGAAIVLGCCFVTLPLVGVELWVAWLGQASRAGDPAWPYVGGPLSRMIGQPLGLAVTALTGVLAVLVPWRHAAVWVGILVVLGSPSLHMFGFLFLVPAMLTVRREVGLLTAALVATYSYPLVWLGIGLLVAATAWRNRATIGARAAGWPPGAVPARPFVGGPRGQDPVLGCTGRWPLPCCCICLRLPSGSSSS